MDVRPFRGWRYASASGDVSPYIAPPYDVIDAAQREALLRRHRHNVVAVDLSHFPPHDAGPQKEYQHAAWVLGEWKGQGVLRQDPRPCLYAYEQQFRWGGKMYTRRGMLAGVRATPLGQDVVPHEHTFAGPKLDRLQLTRHTRMQLSPVFAFYEDAQGEAAAALWAAAQGLPDLWGELHGVTERLWAVDDPAVLASVQNALAPAPCYIADGHHRYATALNYRDELRAAGQIDDEHEANFVLFALVRRDDPGLLVLGTHRIVRGLRSDFTVARLAKAAEAFDWQRCSLDDANLREPDAFLRRYGPGAMALLDSELAEVWIARLRDADAMKAAAPDACEAWRSLDVAVLHKLLIDRALVRWRTDDVFVEYTPDARAVRAACESGRAQLGVCLQATPLSAVEAVADAGESMPHKSTYFYPKLATGLVFKPLE